MLSFDENGKENHVLVSRPCHVVNTSSHSNTEVKQNWAWVVTWMGDCLGTLGAADKNQKPGSIVGAC